MTDETTAALNRIAAALEMNNKIASVNAHLAPLMVMAYIPGELTETQKKTLGLMNELTGTLPKPEDMP